MILGQGSAREMMQRRKGGMPQTGSEKLRWRKDQVGYRQGTDGPERPKDDLTLDVHLEGHLATEASFIILDTLERCVATISQWDSQQNLVGLALSVLLHALGKNQSTTVLPHMFASQRSLVFKVIIKTNLNCFTYQNFSFTVLYSMKKVIIVRIYVYFY